MDYSLTTLIENLVLDRVRWIVKFWGSVSSEAVKSYLLKIKSKPQNNSPETNMEILGSEQLTL